VYDASFLNVAASGDFWFVRSTVILEEGRSFSNVGITTGGVFGGFPIHAHRRTCAMIPPRQTGIHMPFMYVRKENLSLNYFDTFQILE